MKAEKIMGVTAKITGVLWMLSWFVFMLHAFANGVIDGGKDPIIYLAACVTTWVILAVGPIAIIKFGWSYIGRG